MIGACVSCPDGYQVLEEGQYCKYEGIWWARPPGRSGIANLASHEVTEHEDGTITVASSIALSEGRAWEWHGYLERGVWRDA